MVDLQKGVDGYAAGSVLEDALKGLLDQRAQILLVLKKNLKVKDKRYLCRNMSSLSRTSFLTLAS